MLRRFPRLKALLKRLRGALFTPSSASSNYVEMVSTESDAESVRLRGAWQADELPQKQRKLVDRQLADYRSGAPIDVFDVMVQALRRLAADSSAAGSPMTVLEVGCSSGFYSEVFDIAGLDLRYTGADYSAAFVALAKSKYPALHFDVEDATALSYARGAFDVVISGCCLLHIPEYEAAVAETARVAREYAIFHRTPVVWGQPNKYYRKLAYGVETVEIHFNEPQFLELLRLNGLHLIETWTLSEDGSGSQGSAVRTYLCRRD
jgi:SAM-dependent methyltransferase